MPAMETERLVLRRWTPGDIDRLAAVFAEPAVWRYPFGRGLTRDESQHVLDRLIDHWDTYGFGMWAVEVKDEPELIGYVGLAVPNWLPEVLPAVEVGWRLHPAYWGRGLATEGGRASLRHGFEEMGLDRIIAILQPENAASARVVEKLGMRHHGNVKDRQRGTHLAVYEMTPTDWEDQQ